MELTSIEHDEASDFVVHDSVEFGGVAHSEAQGSTINTCSSPGYVHFCGGNYTNCNAGCHVSRSPSTLGSVINYHNQNNMSSRPTKEHRGLQKYRTNENTEPHTPSHNQTNESIQDGLQRSFRVDAREHDAQASVQHVIALRDEVDDYRPKTFLVSAKLAIHLWISIIRKFSFILTLVLLCMCLYYIPARQMDKNDLENVSDVVYGTIRAYIRWTGYYSSILILFIRVFSVKCSKKAICFVILPCMTIDFCMPLMSARNVLWVNVLTNMSSFLAGSFSFYFIRNCKEPSNMTRSEEISFLLTKDGTPYSLMKGLIWLYFIVGFFIQKFLPYLNDKSFMIQVCCRLFLFPLIFSVSKSFQTLVIFNLSEEHMERRMIVNRICSIYIKFIGRIVLSSLSTNGENFLQYILVNILVAGISVITSTTFKKRLSLSYDLLYWISGLLPIRRSNNRVERHYGPEEDFGPSRYTHAKSTKEQAMKKSIFIRNLTLYDEIAHEFMVVIIAPLLMYFLYPIYPSTSFNTTSTIQECFIQIFIQLVILFIGDIVSLAFEIRNGNIIYYPESSLVEFKNRILYISFSIFCVALAQYYVSL